MKFSDQTKAWISLICLVIGTGGAITVTSYEGGAKLWIAILCGLGTGATNVYHALASSPNDKADDADLKKSITDFGKGPTPS